MLPDGKVKYKYGLESGVCRVSSVREILAEQGLHARMFEQ
jgi:hypothetical protein